MSFKYNNKFGYGTFEEQAKALDKPVHCLTWQGADAYEKLMSDGIYVPELDKCREQNDGYYKSLRDRLGYVPIWVLNPLQFGTEVNTKWDPEWFVDGSLWRRFLETCGLGEKVINQRLLLEVVIPSAELQRDITLDYGYISVVKELRKESLVGLYRLQYTDLEQDTPDDWFYPTIYPSRDNKPEASFKEITNFREPD